MFFCLFLLFLVLMVLKILGHVDWSWWLVTMPLWAVPASAVGCICLGIALDGLVWLKRKAKMWLKACKQAKPPQ